MAIEYGFFNSVGDDRLYNAETFNTYFEGLISKNGVFENVTNRLGVTADGTGLTIVVNIGKAIVNSHWVKLTAPETLAVATPHNLFARWDRVVLRWNSSTRDITLHIMEGTPASQPQRDAPARSASIYEIILAYVFVPANATRITNANIYDMRNNTAVCGFVTGLINQVDTTTLFNQYENRMQAMEARFLEWMNDQQNQFDAWYYNLTQELTVGASIASFRKTVIGGSGVSGTIQLNMVDYTYESNDVIICNLNGLILQKDIDYTLVTNVNPVEIRLTSQQMSEGNRFDVLVLKSNMTQSASGFVTSARGNKLIHIEDALAGAAKGFLVGTTGVSNTIVTTNRNLFRIDLFANASSDGVLLTKNADGSITISGTATSATTNFSRSIDKNAFIPGYTYTINSGKSSGNVIVQIKLDYTDETSDTFNSVDEPLTFSVTKEVASATGIIITGATGSINETVKPQLEVGDTANEFEMNSYVTFPYDGVTKPILTENINNIYSTDDGVSDLQIIYIVDAGYIENGDNIEF